MADTVALPPAAPPEIQAPQTQDAQPAPAGAVTSPMVGTVYLQSGPDEPAYVRQGDKVKAGDTLLIIEAMKVMNPIKADKDGTVTQILVSDAQPVEFGDALLVIE